MTDPTELPSIDLAMLDTVTGGADSGMSGMMLPIMMMMKKRGASQASAAVAPAAPGPTQGTCTCPNCGTQTTMTSA